MENVSILPVKLINFLIQMKIFAKIVKKHVQAAMVL